MTGSGGLDHLPGFGRDDVRLGFGAATIGNLVAPLSDDQCARALEAAWSAGIRHFDTAPHYGLGLSERRLGRFLSTVPRKEYTLSTKVGRVLDPNPDYAGGDDSEHGFAVPDKLVRRFDPTEDGVRRSLEDSLERLGVDHVDIAYLHDPDAYDLERGLAEGLPALELLRAEGTVAAIGIGTTNTAAATEAVRRADLDLVMISGRLTLLDATALDELLPACVERGVGVVAASPFNSGLLATDVPSHTGLFEYGAAPPAILDRAQRLAADCESAGVALPVAALQYPLQHLAVRSVMVGMADARAVGENRARLSVPVPPALWDRLARPTPAA